MTELLIKEALSATSYLCIIPAGDYLELLSEGRINAPGTDAGNWQWRMREESFDDGLIWHCDLLSSIYGRKHKLKSEQK